jgi:hypothetical protein
LRQQSANHQSDHSHHDQRHERTGQQLAGLLCMHCGQLAVQFPDVLLGRFEAALRGEVSGRNALALAEIGQQKGQAEQPDTGQQEHDGVQDREPGPDGTAAQRDHVSSMPSRT